MKRVVFLFLPLALVGFSTAAFAQDLRLDLRIGAQVLPDESVDFVSDENTVPTQTLRVSSELLPNTRVVVEYGSEAPEQVRRYRETTSSFVRQRFTAGADWGPTLFGIVRPFVGATAGYALGSLEFKTDQFRYSDYSHDFIVDGYLGAEVTLELGSTWYLVGGTRAGVRGQTAADFDELETSRPDNDPWTRVDPRLGTLYPNGWYIDFGIGVGLTF